MGLFHYLTTYEGISAADVLFRQPGYDLVPKTARQRLLMFVDHRRLYPRRNFFLCGASMLAIVLIFMPAPHSDIEDGLTALLGIFAAVAAIVGIYHGRQDRLRSLLLEWPCWKCGCSLLDTASGRCPECGAAFDAAEYERIEAAFAADAPEPMEDTAREPYSSDRPSPTLDRTTRR